MASWTRSIISLWPFLTIIENDEHLVSVDMDRINDLGDTPSSQLVVL